MLEQPGPASCPAQRPCFSAGRGALPGAPRPGRLPTPSRRCCRSSARPAKRAPRNPGSQHACRRRARGPQTDRGGRVDVPQQASGAASIPGGPSGDRPARVGSAGPSKDRRLGHTHAGLSMPVHWPGMHPTSKSPGQRDIPNKSPTPTRHPQQESPPNTTSAAEVPPQRDKTGSICRVHPGPLNELSRSPWIRAADVASTPNPCCKCRVQPGPVLRRVLLQPATER